jgi:hypothetical protein
MREDKIMIDVNQIYCKDCVAHRAQIKSKLCFQRIKKQGGKERWQKH